MLLEKKRGHILLLMTYEYLNLFLKETRIIQSIYSFKENMKNIIIIFKFGILKCLPSI